MNLYCNSTTISLAISNSSSNRMFTCHSRNFLPRFPDGVDDEVARILHSRQHLWSLAASYIWLDIMGGIYDLLRLSNDNTFKNFLWARGFDLLIEQCRIVSVDENFLSVRTLRKMEQKWKEMNKEYARLKSLSNLTGIGGVHPNITWPFYDVGQVLKNDKDIHWDVNIESMSLDADNTGTIRTRGQEEGDTAQRRHPTVAGELIRDRIINPAKRFRSMQKQPALPTRVMEHEQSEELRGTFTSLLNQAHNHLITKIKKVNKNNIKYSDWLTIQKHELSFINRRKY